MWESNGKATELVSMKRNEEALPYYLRAAETEPTDPVAWANIGYEYYKLEQFVKNTFIYFLFIFIGKISRLFE